MIYGEDDDVYMIGRMFEIDVFDDDLIGLDVDIDIDIDVGAIPETKSKKSKKKVEDEDKPESVGMKKRQSHTTRRAFSEQAMNKILDWHLEKGMTYHIISGGDIDALTYIRGIIKQQKLDYLLISTWSMGMTDAIEIGGWVSQGLVKRLDLYVGDLFMGAYSDIYHYFADEVMPDTGGRVCIIRNHSKVTVGYGDKFNFAVASSANLNTNPRIETTTITVDTEVADFYKTFYDTLKPYNEWVAEWSPWERENDN